MREWRRVKLGDVAKIITGYPFKSADFEGASGGGPRLCRGVNVGPGRLVWGDVRTWPKERVGDVKQFRLERDDVVLAMDRPWIEAGLKFGRVTASDAGSLLVQRVARLRGGDELDQRFLQYVISAREFTDHVKGVHTGTTIPHISGKQIALFEFRIPPLDEQRRIAEVLRALDDKIEVNRATISTLEESVACAFMIDFAEAGTDGVLGDLVDHLRASTKPFDKPADRFEHYSLPAFDATGLPEHVEGREIRSAKTRVVQGSVLVSKLNPRIPRVWIPSRVTRGAVCSTEFQVFVPVRAIDRAFVWAFVGSAAYRDRLIGAATGTSGSHQRVRPADMLDVALPANTSEVAREEFGRWAEPRLGLADHLRHENHALAATRDALLPKLMSGELRVTDAERRVGEAL